MCVRVCVEFNRARVFRMGFMKRYFVPCFLKIFVRALIIRKHLARLRQHANLVNSTCPITRKVYKYVCHFRVIAR